MIAIVSQKAPPKHITTRNEDDEDDEDLVSPLKFRAIFFFPLLQNIQFLVDHLTLAKKFLSLQSMTLSFSLPER
jgi:hypothetical protein